MMKRKTYMKPTMQVVKLQQQHRLLNSSPQGDLPDSQKPKTYDWD